MMNRQIQFDCIICERLVTSSDYGFTLLPLKTSLGEMLDGNFKHLPRICNDCGVMIRHIANPKLLKMKNKLDKIIAGLQKRNKLKMTVTDKRILKLLLRIRGDV